MDTSMYMYVYIHMYMCIQRERARGLSTNVSGVAAAFGVKFARAATAGELDAALTASLKCEQHVLIEAVTDRQVYSQFPCFTSTKVHMLTQQEGGRMWCPCTRSSQRRRGARRRRRWRKPLTSPSAGMALLNQVLLLSLLVNLLLSLLDLLVLY